jgi:3-oxoacyl-[acyl-carrier protein] reductase
MAKNILITGASRGLGKAIKLELNRCGFNCIAPVRDELNMNDLQSIENYFDKLDISIDGLVNNAGINILGTINSINDEDIENMLNINLIAPLKLIKYISKDMKIKKYGKIVNISSIWGVQSKEFRTLYSMTKFGLNGITKSLARELGEYNILVNSVAPGYINTEMTQNNISVEEQNQIKETIPLKRFAEPSEIAKLIVFLLSKENSYITGQTIIADGGFLA